MRIRGMNAFVRTYIVIPLLLSLWAIFPSQAHLVSYEGGSEVMVESMGSMRTQVSAIYSPKWWLGTGLVYDRLQSDYAQIEGDVYSAQVAVLLKRWNLAEAQGNLYVHFAPGYLKNSFLAEESTELIFKYGARADYETRRIYVAAEYFSILGLEDENKNKNLIDSFALSLGVAPYIAQYEDLNTWFITKVMWQEDFKRVDVFPTARFFFKNVLWEVGQSLKGESLFSFMMRY